MNEMFPVTSFHVGANSAAVTLLLANDMEPASDDRIYVLSVDQALDLAGGIAQALARTSGGLTHSLKNHTLDRQRPA